MVEFYVYYMNGCENVEKYMPIANQVEEIGNDTVLILISHFYEHIWYFSS